MSLRPSKTKTNSDGPLAKKPTTSSLRFPKGFEVQYGPFQACNVTLNEAAFEKQILRVHLDNENFSKKTSLKVGTTLRASSRPKQLSSKLRRSTSPVKNSVDQSKTPRPRGRPPKVSSALIKADTRTEKENLKTETQTPRTRGRPPKLVSTSTKAETPTEEENLKDQIQTPRGRGRPPKIVSTAPKIVSTAPKIVGTASKIVITAPKVVNTSTKVETEKEYLKNLIQVSKGSTRKKNRQMDITEETPKSNGEDLQIKINNLERKKVYNGPSKKKGEYRLKMLSEPKFEDRRLNYKFSKLAVDVRSLRLPAPHWKIKIYMRNKAISAIAFTNKNVPERALKFSSATDLYEVTIEGRKARLLGSPVTIDGRADVEALLDIVHSVETDNPMIDFHNN